MDAREVQGGRTDGRAQPAVRPRAAVVPAVLGGHAGRRREDDRARVGAAGLWRGRHASRGSGSRSGVRRSRKRGGLPGPGRRRGRPSFVFSMLGAPNEGAVRRANEKGAAAIFEVNMLPGNARYQAYPARTSGPAFTVGHDDGVAAREVIGGNARRPVGPRQGEAERRARAELEDGTHLGRAAWRHRRDHLHHGAPRWLVRCVRRQRQRCRVDDRVGGALQQDSAGTAQADDDVRRARRPSQLG